MASVDYFLEIDGIKGESQDAKHKGKIDVQSWSWGESNSGSHSAGGGGGAGKVNMQDFHFTMHMSSATPNLLLACASGDHIKKAQLICRKAGKEQQEYLTIDFDDLMISSYQTGGSAGASMLPIDQISFNYSKIKMTYKPQKADGSLDSPKTAGWDLKKNQKAG